MDETRLTQLLSDGSPTKIFRLKEEALADFKTYAKKYNIQYSAIREVDAKVYDIADIYKALLIEQTHAQAHIISIIFLRLLMGQME